MVRITPAMAAISREALTWYAQLLESGRSEFTLADYPDLQERTMQRYIAQLRTGWCDIQVVRRGRGDAPAVYGLPAAGATAAEAIAGDRAAAAAFASAWASRPESALAPCSAADYLSLRAMVAADVPAERFERALTSKLIELSAADLMSSCKPSRRLAWLRAGIGRALASMPAAAPAAPAPNPTPAVGGASPDDAEYTAYAKKVLANWRPPWERPGAVPQVPAPPKIDWNAGLLPSGLLPGGVR